ncbi:deoxyuridine 5'-triphosphate nucleotidohydrolase [Dehalogenimonas sp. WBC-2]|nr:deoxyuridine 5'-triphosphate nucleotidohydrolase [Dehalogenimonas sp. WBC-2]
MTVLPSADLRRLIENTPPLLSDFLDIEQQIQPNGIDLTLREIFEYSGPGTIAIDNADRKLAPVNSLVFDQNSCIHLKEGLYLITYNEVVSLPKDIMALGRARSSLLRCGAAIHTAVWDAGYTGRSQSLLVVYNKEGITLEKNARLMQLVFFRLSEPTAGYCGIYQGENIGA